MFVIRGWDCSGKLDQKKPNCEAGDGQRRAAHLVMDQKLVPIRERTETIRFVHRGLGHVIVSKPL